MDTKGVFESALSLDTAKAPQPDLLGWGALLTSCQPSLREGEGLAVDFGEDLVHVRLGEGARGGLDLLVVGFLRGVGAEALVPVAALARVDLAGVDADAIGDDGLAVVADGVELDVLEVLGDRRGAGFVDELGAFRLELLDLIGDLFLLGGAEVREVHGRSFWACGPLVVVLPRLSCCAFGGRTPARLGPTADCGLSSRYFCCTSGGRTQGAFGRRWLGCVAASPHTPRCARGERTQGRVAGPRSLVFSSLLLHEQRTNASRVLSLRLLPVAHNTRCTSGGRTMAHMGH